MRSTPAASPVDAQVADGSVVSRRRIVATLGAYPYWFYLPALIVFGVIFVAADGALVLLQPDALDPVRCRVHRARQLRAVPREPSLTNGLRNTFVYAFVTSGLKVVLGLLLAALLTSSIRLGTLLRAIVFFPVLVSTVAVGITFAVLMHPSRGLINTALAAIGIDGPAWLIDTDIALLSVALVDVWKGVGIALVIFIAGILSIPEEYSDAARLEGGAWVQFRHIIVPLSRNATFTVILLSFIGGLRTFDLIWTMTRGGPGFTTDVLTSTIYKQYQAGLLRPGDGRQRDPVHRRDGARLPAHAVLLETGDRAVSAVRFVRKWWIDAVALAIVGIVFVVPFVFIVFTAAKDQAEARPAAVHACRRTGSSSTTSSRSSASATT